MANVAHMHIIGLRDWNGYALFVPKMGRLTVIRSGNIYYSTSVLECTNLVTIPSSGIGQTVGSSAGGDTAGWKTADSA